MIRRDFLKRMAFAALASGLLGSELLDRLAAQHPWEGEAVAIIHPGDQVLGGIGTIRAVNMENATVTLEWSDQQYPLEFLSGDYVTYRHSGVRR